MKVEPGVVMRVEAPAKVNLLLRILDRSPDGYHHLETLFQAVGLSDSLTLEVVEGDRDTLEVRGADVGPAADNLVTRAVARFREATGFGPALRVVLEKRIPAGAGLGGGSSDAGAVLRALNLLCGTPLTSSEVMALGGGLGADVAFFSGSAALALGEGRGDRLRPLPPLPVRPVILGLPPVHVATGPAYGALALARTGGLPVPRPLLQGRAPADWDQVAAVAVNDFEAVIPGAFPPVGEALRALRLAGPPLAHLSGSGAAVFAVLPPGGDGTGMEEELRSRAPGIRWVVTATLDELPLPERVEPEARIH
ncbi:MAG TPA: 4-(cytidine 5'-diphospho)-2-C-methyl-D-erythritol kinase [Longimicrobiales bacterium]|nr:4-(cytidine 5'-diphospho)-2-C-methyl-D-erythritol kinase [Longimicrobiales bacterium]